MFIDIIKAIFLGVVEGVTEFLPISSTGHLIIFNEWINFSEQFTKLFDVVIQLGAILAVVIFFWSKIWPVNLSLWKKILVGVIPAIVIGGLFGGFIQDTLFNPWTVAIALIVGGIILIFIEKRKTNIRYESVTDIPVLTTFYIGLIQCISMIPGTSRAAATIIGAMLLGTSRSAAVEFSFFLAIPTMIAASSYSLLKHGKAMSGSEALLLIIGFITSFVVALTVIKFFMKYIKNHDMRAFGYYRIVLGILVIFYFGFLK